MILLIKKGLITVSTINKVWWCSTLEYQRWNMEPKNEQSSIRIISHPPSILHQSSKQVNFFAELHTVRYHTYYLLSSRPLGEGPNQTRVLISQTVL